MNLNGWRQPKKGIWKLEFQDFKSPIKREIDWWFIGRAVGIVIFGITFVVLGLLPFKAAAIIFPFAFGMAQQTIDLGIVPGDKAGDKLRVGGEKINANFNDLYSSRSRTLNPATFPGATIEEQIQNAINQGLLTGEDRVEIPAFMLPYNAGIIVFSNNIQMTREGGSASYYDLRAYGGAGNRTTVDNISVQQTYNAAAANNGIAYIPQGQFRVTTKLFMPTNLEVAGAGISALLFFDWFDSIGTNSGGSVYMQNLDTINGNTGIRLHDFAIEGGNTSGLPAGTPANGVTSCFLFRRGSDIDITRLRITKVPGISISYQGISQARFTNNYISQSGRDGITGGPYGTSPCTDIVIANNTLYLIGDDGIAVNASVDTTVFGTTRPSRITIVGNTIYLQTAAGVPNSAGRGVLLNGVENFSVTGNVIVNTFSAGIFTQADVGLSGFTCREGTISSNTIESAGRTGDGSQPQSGLRICGSFDLTISSNTITDAKTNGILVSDNVDAGQAVGGLVIIGNTVKGCGTTASTDTGIILDARTANGIINILVTGNRVTDCISGGIGVRSVLHAHIIGNHCTNNGKAGGHSSLEAGIWLAAASGFTCIVTVRGNYCTDTQGTKTQTSGVCFANLGTAVNHATVQDNYLKGNFNSGTNGEVLVNLTPTTLIYRRDDTSLFVLTDAATVAVNALSGSTQQVTLAGNRTMGLPTNPSLGQRILFIIIQDGTGGRTINFATNFPKFTWSDVGNTLGKRSSIAGVYDGANWNQDGAQTPYA